MNRQSNQDNQSQIDATPTDIGNHADTHFFGQHFRPVLCNDKICSVFPFLSEYDNTKNVELCSEFTVWTADRGEVYPLIFGQC